MKNLALEYHAARIALCRHFGKFLMRCGLPLSSGWLLSCERTLERHGKLLHGLLGEP